MAKESEHYEQRIQTACLLILTALGITGALYFFKGVLIPFVLALFLTLSLVPVIDLQMKWLRIPRYMAILTTVAVGCAILALATQLVTVAADQIVRNKDGYDKQFQQLLVRAGRLRISYVTERWTMGSPTKKERFGRPFLGLFVWQTIYFGVQFRKHSGQIEN